MTDDSQSLFEQAVAASRQKDFASARVLLRQLLKQEPNHLNAWLLAAHVVESRPDAIACFKRVLQLDPGHVYARQKLSALQSEPPAASPVDPSGAHPPSPSGGVAVPASQPPAPPRVDSRPQTGAPPPSPPGGVAVPANRPIAPRPEAIQPPVDIRPQIPVSSPPASSANLQVGMIMLAGVLILVILCLAVWGIGASSKNGLSLFGTAVPTPADGQLFNVLYQNALAAGGENITAYMATIHPKSSVYSLTESSLPKIFSQYDLTYQFYNLRVISAKSNEAKVHFSLVTRKVNGPAFRNNIITGTMTLRPDNGVWKLYNQEVEDTQFEN